MSTSKRKVIVYIAASLDGFIATQEDNLDFLSIVEKENEDYGYNEFVQTVDTVIMGRKTYEKVLSFPVDFPHKERDCYVLTKSKKGNDENVTFYNGNVKDLIDELMKKEGKNIFVDGGAGAVHALREQNLIDEYVISIIPVLLGNGIRLFKDTNHQQNLELVESQAFDTGLVQVKYKVK